MFGHIVFSFMHSFIGWIFRPAAFSLEHKRSSIFSIQLKLQKKHIRHLYHKNAKNQFGGASPLVNPAENTIEHVSVLMETIMVSTGM